ncbi:MAG: cytochrome oxidase putative small subunit CydP [Gammaproteobacteria bacterium]
MVFKKITGRRASFGLEIAAALLVKFVLLGGIWWLFFAGQKQAVDGSIIADKMFGGDRPVIISQKDRENSQ